MTMSPDALIAAGTTLTLAGVAALWKLASLLSSLKTTVDTELNHNGGSSLKDAARSSQIAAETSQAMLSDAVKFFTTEMDGNRRVINENIAQTRRDLSDHSARVGVRHGEIEEALRKLQHDLTNVRMQVTITNQDRLAKEEAWTARMREQGIATPDPQGVRVVDGPDLKPHLE